MSRGEEDDTRQYQCLRKYEAIVKQVCGTSVFRFDELINMVDARTRSRPPKRRRLQVPSSSSSAPPPPPPPLAVSSRGITAAGRASSDEQSNIDEAFVQTITRFLHELKPSPTRQGDSTSSSSTQD